MKMFKMSMDLFKLIGAWCSNFNIKHIIMICENTLNFIILNIQIVNDASSVKTTPKSIKSDQ